MSKENKINKIYMIVVSNTCLPNKYCETNVMGPERIEKYIFNRILDVFVKIKIKY